MAVLWIEESRPKIARAFVLTDRDGYSVCVFSLRDLMGVLETIAVIHPDRILAVTTSMETVCW